MVLASEPVGGRSQVTELLCLHVYGVKFQNVYNDYINCIYYGEKLGVYYIFACIKISFRCQRHVYAAITDII